MKAETDSITPDEWLLRLVYQDRFTNRVPVISPNAFEPRVKSRYPDTDGISLYRKDCLNDPADALLAVAEEKRPLTGIVQIPVSLLTDLSLTVRPAPDVVPGHVVVPELSAEAYSLDKARFTPIKLRLAEVASENILRRPVGSSST
jgi:hypothetical protein